MASVGCCPQDQRFSGPAARSLRVSDVLNDVMCEMYVLTASRYVSHSSFTDDPEPLSQNPG